MTTDLLIIGQGIAGTLLSFYLQQAGYRVLVIDDGASGRASRVAGAVINPLSGKNWTMTQDAGLLLPVALDCYAALEKVLQKPLLKKLPLYIFDARPELSLPSLADDGALSGFFNIRDKVMYNMVWLVDAATLLDSWKEKLEQENAFIPERFDRSRCSIASGYVRYRDIGARGIIFCEGAGAAANDLFRGLPFTRNRGEALLLDIPGLPGDALYHRSLRLVPRQDGRFWCGSNYRWAFSDLAPDRHWRRETEAALAAWLKIPFTVTDHIVAERPTTAGQIPLVGLHPKQPEAAIFSGLGTRGFSSGPFWAAELAKKIADHNYEIRNYNEAWLSRKLS